MEIFEAIRRITIFLLGVLVIIEGLYGDQDPATSIILGMIMIGLLPLENLLPWQKNRGQDKKCQSRE